MELQHARSFAGKGAHITWIDRKGEQISSEVQVFDATFVPLYGPCLVTDSGDIRLDRIVDCYALDRAA
jgi:hypothetical protein